MLVATAGTSQPGSQARPQVEKKLSDLQFWALVGLAALVLMGLLSAWALSRRPSDDEHEGQENPTPEAALAPPTQPPTARTPAPAPPPVDSPRSFVPVEGSPSRGPQDALVTLVEFSDFQCPFCSRVQPTLTQLLERYPRDLRIVFKNHPLAFHQNARSAAEAALAASSQGRFWEMHDQLFAHQRELGPAFYRQVARDLGMNCERFAWSLDHHDEAPAVAQDEALAERLQHNMGTPTFYINGQKLAGAQPLNRFVALIDRCRDEALETLRANPQVGRQGYYNHLMASLSPGGAPGP
jgi:protein-disulfide isomerase